MVHVLRVNRALKHQEMEDHVNLLHALLGKIYYVILRKMITYVVFVQTTQG